MYAVVSIVAGSALVMWFGELMTEHGIGNGASILILISNYLVTALFFGV